MKAVTEEELSVMTPMLQQYYRLKNTCLDAILFFRMGDFYEIFGEDACLVAPKLGIVLTSRERGDKNKIGFCGVPHHSARAYWMKLLAMNYKVAIADQVEDASAAKGLVKRDIIKILTPACIDELEGIDLGTANYLMATYEDPKSKIWATLLLDISTGELRLGALRSKDEVLKVLTHYKPKELLTRKFCQTSFKKQLENSERFSHILMGILDESILADASAQQELYQKTFGQTSLAKHPCQEVNGGLELISAILAHMEKLHFKTNHLRQILPLFEEDTMSLDDSVVRDLELLETSRGRKRKGSLLHAIDYTLTPMGSRFLRHSLVNPLMNQNKIQERHEDLEYFHSQGQQTLESLRQPLKACGDLERLSTRIATGHARPAELAKVREALQSTAVVFDNLRALKASDPNKQTLLQKFSSRLELFKKPLQLLNESLQPEPSNLGTDFNLFNLGYDQELDKILGYVRGGQEKITAYQEQLKEETSINVKIKPHKTYGLLIEVTKSNLKKVPPHFVRKQTMVNCDRFITEELKDLDETLSNARVEAIERESYLYQKLMERLAEEQEVLRVLAKGLANLDLTLSFAWLALKDNYCRPTLVEHEALSLVQSRHPVVESFVGGSEFVSNDLSMDQSSKVILITGPNMAGKSTVMRQVALCAILNQIGCYVPCSSAKLPIFDNIYTRVGASDDLSLGLSTFMVEMKEAAHILRYASSKSLLILDEIGRGTSTEDGLGLAHAILDYIAREIKSWTLFATHYHELVPRVSKYPNVKLMQTAVKPEKGSIRFTHKLIPGASPHSYGLEVAKLAGIPQNVIQFAAELIKNKTDENFLAVQEAKKDLPQEKAEVRNEFTELRSQKIMDRLNKVDVNRTSPLQALNILSELVIMHKKNPTESLFHDGQIFF